jgi:hypothetical protein
VGTHPTGGRRERGRTIEPGSGHSVAHAHGLHGDAVPPSKNRRQNDSLPAAEWASANLHRWQNCRASPALSEGSGISGVRGFGCPRRPREGGPEEMLVTGGEGLVTGARRAALALAAEVVGMAGTGAAVRARTAPGPGETPVPGARARVDGKQDGLDGAGRFPGGVVVAEWTVHDERRWPAPCVGRRR